MKKYHSRSCRMGPPTDAIDVPELEQLGGRPQAGVLQRVGVVAALQGALAPPVTKSPMIMLPPVRGTISCAARPSRLRQGRPKS